MSDLLKVCGVWMRTDDNGNVRLSGRYSYETKIVILPNLKRESDKDPSHFVFLAPVQNQGGAHQDTGGAGAGQPQPKQRRTSQGATRYTGGWNPSIFTGSGKTPLSSQEKDKPF